MSKSPKQSFRTALSGRWQIPLLLAGVCLLGGGLIRMAIAHESLSPQAHLERVRRLREAGALTRTHAYLLHLLKDPDHPLEFRGKLHLLLLRTVHRAESGFRTHRPENSRTITANFRQALRCGATPEAEDWIALGEAYDWSSRERKAIDAFDKALALEPPRADRIVRRLIEMQRVPPAPLGPELLTALDRILENPDATARNYYWAVRQKIDWLLDREFRTEALSLVEGAKKRLNGTPERIALTYLEAFCLRGAGRGPEAETLLRSLRNNWTKRDTLWAEAGWLLGKLQQEEGRPQAALSFFEEVMTAFPSGEVYDACRLGRGECLVMLERFDRALDAFRSLRGRLRPGEGHRFLDRDALRSILTAAGESRLQSGDQKLGIQFLELALSFVPPDDRDAQSHLVTRIAGAEVEMARRARAAARTPEDVQRARALFADAARRYLEQADLQPLDGAGAGRALRLAADNFDGAGRTEDVIEVLSRLVRDHPKHEDRAEAQYRLGRAYQALQDYPLAIATFEKVIEDHPRLPDALRSMVPLAECLLTSGGEDAQRGLDLLLDIVDDRGAVTLLAPEAQEYRQALIRLAEFYVHADGRVVPDHYEQAIARLESAISLYPEDEQIPRLRFLLAESYRLSAQRMLANPDPQVVAAVRHEAERRLRSGLANYVEVKKALAWGDASSLSDLERTYLRASYLYVGDSLFDLNELERAVEAYRETAWRYENEPAAISATLQVVHSYQRMGRPAEARAALARLQWLLKKIPAAVFDGERGMSPKAYWEVMARRMERTGI